MGLFDSIIVYQECPACKEGKLIMAQTKDLRCGIDIYRPLPADWDTPTQQAFRAGLPVFRKFPLDKSASIWKDQAEYREAEATIPEEFHGKLNYVDVLADCPSCQTHFRGRIAIREGKLRGGVYNIVQEREEKP